MRLLARAGLTARGVMYMIVGAIAIRIAFGDSRQQADRSGALHLIGTSRFGAIALWLLVAGFIGMALWQLSEAIYGSPGGTRKTGSRLAALARSALYAVVVYGVLEYALGVGSPPSSNQQSVDLTSTVMRHPGGRVAVIVAGLALIGGGLYLAYAAWRKNFLKRLQFTRQMRPGTRRGVEWLGRIGGIARGAVFAIAGVFLVIAAVRAQPQEAKGIDASLRALAAAPLGPWLLLAVAIGLIMFGANSCCEARWRRL
jgi:hypothetical protein